MKRTIANFAAERVPVEFVRYYLTHEQPFRNPPFSKHVIERAQTALRRKQTYHQFITWEDVEFPNTLLDIPNPPYCLFYRGDLEVLQKQAVAMVGSRELNRISQPLITFLEPIIVASTTVSGGARGIDTLVHEASLRVSRPTVCVLASGFNTLYPHENAQLFRKIERNGLLLTEYVPEEPVRKHQFLERNRIVSGLAESVIVIQAAQRSGTMNTVQHALEQGKDVYAVPGCPLDRLAEGPNRLIEEGAIPLTNPHHFVEKMDCSLTNMR